MATRFFSLSRSIFTTKQALTSFLSRSYTVSSSASLSLSQFSALRFRPLAAVAHILHGGSPALIAARPFSTRHTQSSLNDSSPNWSNRPPKETILLDGCDFNHWLVVMEKPDESMTRDQIIDMYIKTLAQVLGSEEEARKNIYSVSTRHYYAFGALVDEEKSYLIKELPKVRWVLPDSYLDVKNQDYGGEPFINGEAVPYDPKYHEEWVRNNMKAMERNRRNDRPRNFDRSRNFERRGQNMQNRGPPGPPPQGMPPTPTPPPPHNVSGMPPSNNMGPPPPQPPPNMGPGPGGYPGRPGAPNSGWQGNQQNFPGGGYPQNSQGPPPNYQNYGPPNNNFRGPPPGGNPGYPQGPPPGGNPGYPQGPPPGGNPGYAQNPQGPPPGGNPGYAQNPQGPPPGGNPGYAQNPQGPPSSNYQNYGPPGNNFRGPPPPGGNPYEGQGDMPPPPTRNY